MKHIRIKILSSIIISTLLFSFLPVNLNTTTPVLSVERNINVGVDYRIELLTIMQYLGGYNYSSKPLQFTYKEEVDKYFELYKGQESIRKVINFKNNSKYRNTPISAMVFFSQPPELKQLVPFTPEILDQAKGEESLLEFVEALRTFAELTKFTEFMEKQEALFAEMKAQTKLKGNSVKFLKQLESYFGIEQHSYNIVLAPFIHCGGFGASLELENGIRDIYCIIGPCSVVEDLPYFRDSEDFEEIIFHEFSHSFINQLSDEYCTDVKECQKLYYPIFNEMNRLRYGEWIICLNEHLVRAFTTRMVAINKGYEEGKKCENIEIKRGFVYLPLILEKYKMYENNRAIYKTYNEFYVYLIEYLKGLCKYPCIPTSFDVDITDERYVGLTWKDNSRDEEGFKIYRKSNVEDPFEILVELPNNSRSFVDTTIEIEKPYWYKMCAFNYKGKMETHELEIVKPFEKPKPVRSFRLDRAEGQDVTISWDYENFCMGFIILELPDQIEIERLNKQENTVTISNVTFGDHLYQLCAYNEYMGEIKLSNPKTPIDVSVLEPPRNIKATKVSKNSIELTWTLSCEKVDKIEVYRKTNDGDFELIRKLKRLLLFTDRRLEPDTFYEYKLVAKMGEVTTSNESVVVKAKTEAEDSDPPEIKEIILKFQIGSKKCWVGEKCIDMDVAPINFEGRMFLPIRIVTDSLGATIAWDHVDQRVIIYLDDIVIELWIGKSVAKVNGVEKPIDENNPNIKPIIVEARTLLPLRFVGESLGCEIRWDAENQEATLIYCTT